MTSLRPLRLTRVLVCLSGLTVAGSILLAQQATPPATPPAGNQNNPFENIPQTTPGTPARPPVTPLPPRIPQRCPDASRPDASEPRCPAAAV